MWFKQATLFQFTKPLKMDQNALSEALEPLSFSPCLPSLPSSLGWVSPIPQDHTLPNKPHSTPDGSGSDCDRLVHGSKRFWIICLQFEDKILPASVIRQALDEKTQEIQQKEARKISAKEKQSLKDEITQTLLPKAFTKKSRVHALIDIDQQRLIINSNIPTKIERFVAFLKRAITHTEIKSFDVKKPAVVMTDWLKRNVIPGEFIIGQACVLQDAQQERRVIRCQHQDLMANAIHAFLKDGCDITQLSLSWKDNLKFTLSADFTLKSIQFQEAVLALSKSDYTETAAQRFDADFVLMTEILSQLIDDLLVEFSNTAFIARTASGHESMGVFT